MVRYEVILWHFVFVNCGKIMIIRKKLLRNYFISASLPIPGMNQGNWIFPILHCKFWRTITKQA